MHTPGKQQFKLLYCIRKYYMSMSNLKNTKEIVLDGLVTLIQSHGVAHTIPHFLINATVWGYYITHFGCFGSKMRQINHAVITHTVAQVRWEKRWMCSTHNWWQIYDSVISLWLDCISSSKLIIVFSTGWVNKNFQKLL